MEVLNAGKGGLSVSTCPLLPCLSVLFTLALAAHSVVGKHASAPKSSLEICYELEPLCANTGQDDRTPRVLARMRPGAPASNGPDFVHRGSLSPLCEARFGSLSNLLL
jgi:hypothetical protein